MFETILNTVLVVLAFGFVIFWHELGHFLAARWAGVRVEQFAVGMGHAIFSFRKGIGFRLGNTADVFEKRVAAEFEKQKAAGTEFPGRTFNTLSLREKYDIAQSAGIGETEYRLSWIPLGGYVKPTGQDDLRPAADVENDDPKAFGAKSVGKRMVIISAGVVMNVILAFALNVLLFVWGFNAPPPVVGVVQPGSPAQKAGMLVGDRIETINGTEQEDFTKVTMNVSLLRDDEPATFVVRRPGVTEPVTLKITPVRSTTTANMPGIGVTPIASNVIAADDKSDARIITNIGDDLPGGSAITAVNGIPIGPNDYAKLDQAIQASAGKPVTLEVLTKDKKTETHTIHPQIDLTAFGGPINELSIVGVRPRVMIIGVKKDSVAMKAGVKAGDVVEQMGIIGTGEVLSPPSRDQFYKWVADAGEKKRQIRFVFAGDGSPREPVIVDPATSKDKGRKIGALLGLESDRPVIGEVVADSAAGKAGLRTGETITAIDGYAVSNWFDIIERLRTTALGTVKFSTLGTSGPREVAVAFGDADHKAVSGIRYSQAIDLQPRLDVRHSTNPIELAKWSVIETKFSIIQVYLTLQRLVERTVPVSNLSGPLGILSAGSSAAERGFDWLIWFTALISANLAVVNFLPIPIVDGGLFLFLLAEKITGKPPSPRVQAVAQVIGLLLLGSLFLFVTYHDIARMQLG